MSSMFSSTIVGLAAGMAAGWGNYTIDYAPDFDVTSLEVRARRELHPLAPRLLSARCTSRRQLPFRALLGPGPPHLPPMATTPPWNGMAKRSTTASLGRGSDLILSADSTPHLYKLVSILPIRSDPRRPRNLQKKSQIVYVQLSLSPIEGFALSELFIVRSPRSIVSLSFVSSAEDMTNEHQLWHIEDE
ncbi:hypothetical protein MPTK1_4g22650 [Marchantia polymorpha subsp. ruderalis]|uniref:Uncharacterized protein n=2 Tax=Marchantia polymorpha TaxID=3197 RepID=A0AAF6BCQ1_MARPO|nr:hypothetical protein MARPO_0020s0035 [Marchantia polymorpha]BBN09785.1 hypothetical protein Mp_4g22650 [Marchantia polymorpha subsp. ruderalis]|eukprot:PTQ44367.1 hypothetical protein MARPO_0020s0035 [Marchantia polymorpha]